jgi:hypothetical protein
MSSVWRPLGLLHTCARRGVQRVRPPAPPPARNASPTIASAAESPPYTPPAPAPALSRRPATDGIRVLIGNLSRLGYGPSGRIVHSATRDCPCSTQRAGQGAHARRGRACWTWATARHRSPPSAAALAKSPFPPSTNEKARQHQPSLNNSTLRLRAKPAGCTNRKCPLRKRVIC